MSLLSYPGKNEDMALIPFVSRGLLWKRMKLAVCFLPSALLFQLPIMKSPTRSPSSVSFTNQFYLKPNVWIFWTSLRGYHCPSGHLPCGTYYHRSLLPTIHHPVNLTTGESNLRAQLKSTKTHRISCAEKHRQ
jgi:hypothetical protein